MGVVANLTVKINASVTDFERAIAGLSRPMVKAGKDLQTIGSALTKSVTLPLAAIGVAVFNVASDFDSAFANVAKTVDASADQLKALEAGIRSMAKEIPTSASDLANIAAIGGQFGVSQAGLLDFTRTIADLSVAIDGISAADAAASLAQIGKVTGTSEADFRRMGSTLVELGNKGNSTEGMILEMTQRLAGAGHAAGMSTADIFGLGAGLSNLGLNAEAAGTAFSKLFGKMNVAVDTGKSGMFGDIAKKGGLQGDFSKVFKSAPTDAILAFVEGLGKLSKEGENLTLIFQELDINDVRMRDSLTRAALATGELRTQVNLANREWVANGALTEEATKKYATIQNQLQLLKNRLADVAIGFRDDIAAAVAGSSGAINGLIDLIAKLAGIFHELPDGMRLTIAALAGIAAAAGPVLYVTGNLIQAWGQVAGLFAAGRIGAIALSATIGALTSPITAVVGAIGGLIVAIKTLTGSWTTAFQIMLPPIGMMMREWQKMTAMMGGTPIKALKTFFGGTGELPKVAGIGKSINGALAKEAVPFADALAEFMGGGGGSVGISAIGGKAEKAFSGFSDSFKEVTKQVNEYMADVDKVGGVTRLTKDQQDKLNNVLKEAIDLYYAQGKAAEIPLKWTKARLDTEIALGKELKVKQFKPLGGAAALMGIPEHISAGFELKAPQLQGGLIGAQQIITGFQEAAPGIGTTLRGAFGDIAKDLGPIIMRAFTGGGDVGKSIGGLIGGKLFGSLGQKLSGGLTSLFGKSIGGALGSIIPGLGTMFGGMLGDFMGKAFNKIFKRESIKVNHIREDFVQSMGGLDALRDKAFAAGVSLDSFLKVSKVEDFNREMQKLLDAIETADLRKEFLDASGGMETLQFTAQRAGFSIEDALNAKTPEEFKKAVDEINKALEAQQKRVDALKSAGSALADRLGIGGLKTDKKTGKTTGAAGNPAALAPIAMAVFGGVLAETGSMTQAMAAVGPALDLLLEKQKQIPAAAMESVRWLLEQRRVITQNADIIAALEADTAILRGLGQAGRLTFDSFRALTQDVAAQFNALTAKGVAQNQALAAMQPALQAIWEATQKYGFSLDAATQKLINMGLKAGMIGPQFKDPAQQMIDALQSVNLTLQQILIQLGGIPAAAAGAANGIRNNLARIEPIRIPVSIGGPPTRLDNRPNASVPHFAKGGTVWKPTLAVVGEDGPEDIVPHGKGGAGGVTIMPGAIVVHGTADAQFAEVLARKIAQGGTLKTQWRGALR